MFSDNYKREAIMQIVPRPDTVFVKGKGSNVWDQHGKCYIDWIQGWAVNSLGHCHADMLEALNRQASQLINISPAYYNAPMLELAKLLTDKSCFDQVFFANSGAEANEGAIKLARKWGKKYKNGAYKIITFTNGFHGRTLATMSASGKKGWDTMYAPQVDGFLKATYNDIKSVESLIDTDTVAVMLEPIQGEGGVIPANHHFLKSLRQLTQDQNILLIFDEVQTGMARTGHLFTYQSIDGIGSTSTQHADFTPDILTLGKGIGGGVPLAALLAQEKYCVFETGEQGGTFNGNPLITAVGYAVVKKLSECQFLENVRRQANYLSKELNALKEFMPELVISERGTGLLRALELSQEIAPQIVQRSFDLKPKGLLINGVRPSILRFMPALNITEEDTDEMITLLKSILSTFKDN